MLGHQIIVSWWKIRGIISWRLGNSQRSRWLVLVYLALIRQKLFLSFLPFHCLCLANDVFFSSEIIIGSSVWLISYWILFGMFLNGVHEMLIALMEGFDIWDISGLLTFLRAYAISLWFNLSIIESIVFFFHFIIKCWWGWCLTKFKEQSSLLSLLEEILTLFKLIINIFRTRVLFLYDVVFSIDVIKRALVSQPHLCFLLAIN